MTDEFKKMIYDHYLSIPHSNSHYSLQKTNLLYFENSNLNVKELYKLFIEYYTDKSGDKNPPITESTYHNHFNHNINFSFQKPKTDVCNISFENRNEVEINTEFRNHKESVDDYIILKAAMLSEKDTLCLEFDFGQNLPLPKISVSEQFYKRLLWSHVFNVHVFGSHKRSYMFFFMEGNLKKGANSVCNFIYDAIIRELKCDSFNKIYLFSDCCGGQNKNYLMMSFLSMVSTQLEMEIHHVYPVRGHSYCSCDRNFGMYGQKKKKVEVIETDDNYYNIVINSRTPPFTTIREADVNVRDFETLLSERIAIPKDLNIRSAVKISYFSNGNVNFFKDYKNNDASKKFFTH